MIQPRGLLRLDPSSPGILGPCSSLIRIYFLSIRTADVDTTLERRSRTAGTNKWSSPPLPAPSRAVASTAEERRADPSVRRSHHPALPSASPHPASGRPSPLCHALRSGSQSQTRSPPQAPPPPARSKTSAQ